MHMALQWQQMATNGTRRTQEGSGKDIRLRPFAVNIRFESAEPEQGQIADAIAIPNQLRARSKDGSVPVTGFNNSRNFGVKYDLPVASV
jgi:hypothetical protein